MAFTNRGLYRIMQAFFRNTSIPTNLYARLVTDAAVADTVNVASDLTQIAAGNGYTAGGMSLTRNATDFDVLTEDDGNHRSYIQLKDLVWTAAGGNLPSSGNGARFMVLTDDNGVDANRDVFCGFDLVAARTISDTQTLTLVNCEMRFASQ